MSQYTSIRTDDDWYEYLDDVEQPGRRQSAKHRVRNDHIEALTVVPSSETVTGNFNPTFTGSRNEREWILTYLYPFYRDQVITDVLRVVKGGKEATVYCCRAHPSTGLELVAAKVYRPKMFRTFKNDADYKWGRPLVGYDGQPMRDRRLLKAVAQGSRLGEAVSHTSWLTHEYLTMTALHDDGGAVPKPVAMDENAILMGYLGDESTPAPALSEVHIDRDEARPLFERVLHNIELMLRHDRIHGDLSAYNILYWEGDVTIIDFPQVIDAYGNPNAFGFLQRDVERVCRYFGRHGLRADPELIAQNMWRRIMPDETYQVRGSRW